MKCWIKRIENNEFIAYFNKNLWKNQNHWVQQRTEAKLYTTRSQARQIIRQYKLKNCEVEYVL